MSYAIFQVPPTGLYQGTKEQKELVIDSRASLQVALKGYSNQKILSRWRCWCLTQGEHAVDVSVKDFRSGLTGQEGKEWDME